MSNLTHIWVGLLILVTWPHLLSAIEYEASIAVEPGDIIDGWRVIDIDTDDAPPVINDRGQIGYFAFVQSLEDPTRFRDVLFSGGRVVIEGRTFLDGLFIDDWDEDSTYLAINNLGMVAHGDFDDLEYVGVEHTLLTHGDRETSIGSPMAFVFARAIDDRGRVAYRAQLEEYSGPDTRGGLFLGRDLILSDGDVVDGASIRPFEPLLSPSGRLAFMGILDDGRRGFFVDGRMVAREGDVIDGVTLDGTILLLDFNDAGNALLWSWPKGAPGPNLLTADQVLHRATESLGGKNIRYRRVNLALSGTDDLVLLAGYDDEDGTSGIGLFYNDQLAWDSSQGVEGLGIISMRGIGMNRRGDIVFAGRFDDGPGRIVTLRRLPADVIGAIHAVPSLLTARAECSLRSAPSPRVGGPVRSLDRRRAQGY